MNTTSINKNFIDRRLASALVWQKFYLKGYQMSYIPNLVNAEGGEKIKSDRLARALRWCKIREKRHFS